MSVAQTRSARRKLALRHKTGRKHTSVADSIERERRAAARSASIKKTSKKK